MKFYSLDTEFTFGKFNGKTLKEVLSLQQSYINWCSINLDYFYISEETIEALNKIKPRFNITAEAKQKLDTKYTKWEQKQKHTQAIEENDYNHRDSTHEKYNGTYAQDVEDWSDQDIDDAFGGEPSMYWNID